MNNIKNKIKGGKADTLTPKKIADKFDVDVKDVKKQIEYGTCIECEHTEDKEKAKEIATDHVSEFPDYYNRLDKMEKAAEKHWNKKENKKEVKNETKTFIKKLLRENIEKASVEQQIAQQIRDLGYNLDDVYVSINHEPVLISQGPTENVEGLKEDVKDFANKLLFTCLVGVTALGTVRCTKSETKVMYKCSYKDARIDKEGLNPNLRATSFYAYDHILKPDEIDKEEARIEPETEKMLNIEIVDGTLELEFEEVDTQGKWG